MWLSEEPRPPRSFATFVLLRHIILPNNTQKDILQRCSTNRVEFYAQSLLLRLEEFNQSRNRVSARVGQSPISQIGLFDVNLAFSRAIVRGRLGIPRHGKAN